MLNQIQAMYRSVKAAKVRSDELVEEGRQMMGWYRSGRKRQNSGQKYLAVPTQLLRLAIDRCFDGAG